MGGKLGLSLIIRDSKGKIVRKQKCHSWTKQFLQIFYHSSGLASLVGSDCYITDTSNASILQYDDITSMWDLNSPAENSYYGLVVGFGTASESPNDYILENLCGEGGDVTYADTIVTEPYIDSTYYRFDISRSITGLDFTGGTTITEIGIYVKRVGPTNGTKYYCIARDLLDTPIIVYGDDIYTIQYSVSTYGDGL